MFSLHTKLSILKALVTKRSPYYIQFYINGRCNLMCRQCNIVETNSRIEEMDLKQIAKTADHLKQIGASIVLLTGGEPFMRKDLPEIVDIFKTRSLDVRLQTAGTKFATREMLQRCYDAGARDINVSLDSLEFFKSDYINAVPGSGKNAIKTIERISDVFRDGSAILSFGTVLSHFNYKEIPAIVEFAQRIGWYVSLVPVHIAHPAVPKGFRSYDNDFVFPPEKYGEMKETIERVIEMKRNGYPVFDSERFLRSSYQFLMGESPTWRKDDICDSPNLYFAIRPNGAFTTCCDYTLINPPLVYEETFPEHYLSRKIEKRKDVQHIIKNCSGCHYGSYPEVTLSVRNPQAFFERVYLVAKSSKGRLHSAQVTHSFVEELERVKAAYPEIYPTDSWMVPSVVKKVQQWQDQEGRKALLQKDRAAREDQGRVRGQGEDVPIQAEKTGS